MTKDIASMKLRVSYLAGKHLAERSTLCGVIASGLASDQIEQNGETMR